MKTKPVKKTLHFPKKCCPKTGSNHALLSGGGGEDVEGKDRVSVYCKGGTDMKVGQVVRFRGRNYHVGVNRTDTSIELVELKRKSVGLWVSRNEVHEVPSPRDQSSQ